MSISKQEKAWTKKCNMPHLTIVAGARPNFMKIAPIIRAIKSWNLANEKQLDYALVHTGQHFDAIMSQTFFTELEIPEPDINLHAGGGTQAEQTAAIMLRFEAYLNEHPTDLVLVVGDVTSTLACSIVAQKAHVKVAHIEGGIRSNDLTMPEEINRLVTDAISNYFFTTSETANTNLRNSGKSDDAIFFVGNTMIDTLLHQRNRFRQPDFWTELKLEKENYFVLTLHRPNNVDDSAKLVLWLKTIAGNVGEFKVVFPVHPRTKKMLEKVEFSDDRIYFVEPQGYLNFNYLVENSKGVITDSGGITEETTVMGIPCLTLRNSTERPETVTIGTNELIGDQPKNLPEYLQRLLSNQWKKGGVPPLWDGKASERIVVYLINLFRDDSIKYQDKCI